MGKNNNVTKLAITGNTRLTLQSIKEILLLKDYEIACVFGLPRHKQKAKVNYVDLESYCLDNNIVLDLSDDWDNFYNFCKNENVDQVITLGDSRILPPKIVNNFDTIGNHGAILPDVLGGASLVWGRMLNLGYWGVSIMKIGEKVDSGDILKVKKFQYHEKTTEEEFVMTADFLTVQALIDVLKGDYTPTPNEQWKVRVRKHTDSYKAQKILQACIENNIPVYMPPRTPDDGVVKNSWPKEFKNVFKIAQNTPYPLWIEDEGL